jgi:hypothetical protein
MINNFKETKFWIHSGYIDKVRQGTLWYGKSLNCHVS